MLCGMAAVAVASLLMLTPALGGTEAPEAPLTHMIWVVNAYKNDYNPLSFSEVHSSDLSNGASEGYLLTLRPGKHIVSPWIQESSEEGTLRAFSDDGYFKTFYPQEGRYSLTGGSKVSADAMGIVRNGFFFTDFPVNATRGRLFAMEVVCDTGRFMNVRALSAKNGEQLARSVGVIDVGDDLYAVCGSTLTSWLPDSETLLVAKNYCSHRKAGQVFSFDVGSNSTTSLFTLAPHQSFCGFTARPSRGEMYALLEEHNITAFPDPDCQNLSGTVSGFKVVRLSGAEAHDVYTAGPTGVGNMWSGGPMDDAAGVWHLILAGSVLPINISAGAANGKMYTALKGEVGGTPALVRDAKTSARLSLLV